MLSDMSDEALLALRLCDLPLSIAHTEIEECIQKLHTELDNHSFVFRPECYLADEWLCPDDEPVIGIPFYLAHPRLKQLEIKMMQKAEGGSSAECMKLLRHEAGHAFNYAYRLYRRQIWHKIFGSFYKDYPDKYKVRPYSRSYVEHLADYYAQLHPDEDFAETFAVWLAPDSNWCKKYEGWRALGKLQYVDALMKEIASQQPVKRKGIKCWAQQKLTMTLALYYTRKRKLYADEYPEFHDTYLKKIFTEPSAGRKVFSASRFISRNRKLLLDNVYQWTRERKYVINEVINHLILRSRELGLALPVNEEDVLANITAYITSRIMHYSYTGSYLGKR